MLLPNSDDAVIDRAKLRDYLLSPQHPLGRFKARVFGALGFSVDRWEELESARRTQHLTQEAEPAAVVAGGRKFTIRAILIGPNGQSALVVSVWFIRVGEAMPRFVTASGRTQALVTLPPSAVREVGDDDLVAVRPATSREV
ncbi:MAG: DUF6883 domain-containing protein [Vicinamibacterales bacterium]